MKILLGYINANVGRENILQPTLGMKVYIRIVMIMLEDVIRVYSMYNLAWELAVIPITIWWLQKLGKDLQ